MREKTILSHDRIAAGIDSTMIKSEQQSLQVEQYQVMKEFDVDFMVSCNGVVSGLNHIGPKRMKVKKVRGEHHQR